MIIFFFRSEFILYYVVYWHFQNTTTLLSNFTKKNSHLNTEQNKTYLHLLLLQTQNHFKNKHTKLKTYFSFFFHIRLNYMDKNTSVQCTEQFHEKKKLNSIIHYNCLRIIVVVFSSCYTLESKSNSLQTSAQTKITYSSISNPKLTRINSSSIYPISVMSLLSNFKVQTKTLTSHYSPRGVDDIKDLRLDSQLLSEASCVVRSPTNFGQKSFFM